MVTAANQPPWLLSMYRDGLTAAMTAHSPIDDADDPAGFGRSTCTTCRILWPCPDAVEFVKVASCLAAMIEFQDAALTRDAGDELPYAQGYDICQSAGCWHTRSSHAEGNGACRCKCPGFSEIRRADGRVPQRRR